MEDFVVVLSKQGSPAPVDLMWSVFELGGAADDGQDAHATRASPIPARLVLHLDPGDCHFRERRQFDLR